MALEVVHDVERAVQQLLNAPKDIEGGTPVSTYAGLVGGADQKLQSLFETYRKGYPFMYPNAERWWKGCIAAEEAPNRTRAEAVEAALDRRGAGPASAPEFVWFIRYFWLRCDKVNKSLPLESRVAPEIVMLKWLVEANEHDNVTLLTSMPYWPMGLEEHGEWC